MTKEFRVLEAGFEICAYAEPLQNGRFAPRVVITDGRRDSTCEITPAVPPPHEFKDPCDAARHALDCGIAWTQQMS